MMPFIHGQRKLTDQNRCCLGDFANILVHLHDLLDAGLNNKNEGQKALVSTVPRGSEAICSKYATPVVCPVSQSAFSKLSS